MSYSKQLLVKESILKSSNKFVEWIAEVTHPLSRFLKRVKRLLEFIPIIWNSYDWDHSYATGLFSYQLQRMVKYLEKNQSHVGWEHDVSRMKTAIELIKRVDEDYYSLQYYDLIEQKYGKHRIDFIPIDNSDTLELSLRFEKEYTDQELADIEKEERFLMKESILKQEKAKRILWKFINHNIENWWS
jgi:hypothetical protein